MNLGVGSLLYRSMAYGGRYQAAQIVGQTKTQFKLLEVDFHGRPCDGKWRVMKRTLSEVGSRGRRNWHVLGVPGNPENLTALRELQENAEEATKARKQRMLDYQEQKERLANEILQRGTCDKVEGPFRMMSHVLEYEGVAHHLVYTITESSEFSFRRMKEIHIWELDATVWRLRGDSMSRSSGTYRSPTLHQAVKLAIVGLVL